jgi:hypothetical protein
MRFLIIIAGAASLLAACGNNDQTDNTQNLDENLTAENIVANDVTAIDAVTADAANMAADVNFTEPEENEGDPANSVSSKSRPAAKPADRPSERPPAEPASNSAANATE